MVLFFAKNSITTDTVVLISTTRCQATPLIEQQYIYRTLIPVDTGIHWKLTLYQGPLCL